MKIGIIGTGVYSVGMALTLASNKENKITLWSENEQLVKDFKKNKKLNTIFEGQTIPKNISVTASFAIALEDADIVFLMTSINYLDDVSKEIKKYIKRKTLICIGTKGIKNSDFVFDIVDNHLKNKIAVISGPTFADDLKNLEPVGFTIASKSKKCFKTLNKLFELDNVSVENSKDLTGVSLCGSVKNVYAIGSGIINGLGFNESTEALYLNSVYHELAYILYKFNSSIKVLESFAGFGDLVLTCTSNKSRNYTYGKMISSKTNKKDLEKYLKDNTVEGITILEEINKLLKNKHIKAPIIECINNIINNKENSDSLIKIITKKRQ